MMRKIKIIILMTLFLHAFAHFSEAHIVPKNWEVGALINNDRELDFRLGYTLTKRYALEISSDRMEVLDHLRPNSHWVPYLTLGVGKYTVSKDETSPMILGGVGLKYFLGKSEKIVLRGDFRHKLSLENNYRALKTIQDSEWTIGVSYVWRWPEKKKIPFPSPDVSFTMNVLFDSGSTTPQAMSEEDIQTLADFMSAHPNISIQIEGHTDNTGTSAANMLLSQQRADSVRDATLALGIAPKRISAKGIGSNEPVGDNATHEGRQKNRRVVARIIR